MINEVLQVENLLKGEGIGKKCTYWHFQLLARYYIQKGFDVFETRRNICEWADKYHVEWNQDLNKIIMDEQKNKQELRGDVPVRISKEDIDRIENLFDSTKSRRAALAMLCYAKATADDEGYYFLPVTSFANWIKQDYSYVSRHYMKEMKGVKFIESNKRSKTDERIYTWEQKKRRQQKCNFRIRVPFNNTGSHVLVNNDIDTLYKECFEPKTID